MPGGVCLKSSYLLKSGVYAQNRSVMSEMAIFRQLTRAATRTAWPRCSRIAEDMEES